jgi:hypothetical protein
LTHGVEVVIFECSKLFSQQANKKNMSNRYDDLQAMATSPETLKHWDKMYEEALNFLHTRADVPKKEIDPDPLRDNSKQQELFEAMYGIRVKAERPHEFALAFLLRPFSKPTSAYELPQIVASGFSPGYHFIGLEKEGTRFIPSGINAQHYTPRHIRTENDLAEALAQVWKRTDLGLSFFEASDELWRRVVIEFVIVADVSEATPGLEWEIKELVPLYKEKFMCFAIDSAAAPFGPYKSELLNGVKIVPVINRYNQTLSQYTFLDFTRRRGRYDEETSRSFLHQLIDNRSWANEYWAGITALAEGRIPPAVEHLSDACAAASVAGDWPLSVYPGVALADAMTWAGLREPRRRLLLLLVKGKTDESCLLNKSHHELFRFDVDLIRKVLKLPELHPELPLAIWQYSAMLTGGLTYEILLNHDLAVAPNLLPTSMEDFESTRVRINENSLERLKVDMALEHAVSALKLSAAFKYDYGEMLALLYLVYSWFLLGADEKCRQHAARGSELALELGEQRIAEMFSFFLNTSGKV